MDFFAQQDKARRNTRWLMLYFLLAVGLIVLAVNIASYGMFLWFIDYDTKQFFIHSQDGYWLASLKYWFSIKLWWQVAVLTVFIIGFSSAMRIFELRDGGEKIADMVKARHISSATQDPDERRLRNVTEEMAIASGVSMPKLYVMDNERGINAFVAGYKPGEAVLVVTKGCLEQLNRDQLQGVVGHEFSHILNGDMRLNIRLIGLLAGILMIGQIGMFLVRANVDINIHDRDAKRRGGGVLIAIVFGLMLAAIGYLGVFFGRLIKAGVSRQREFLADAAATQFTRDSRGLAGALLKIRKSAGGSALRDSHAEEMSHMCFGQSIKMRFFSTWLATHPPLEARIKALGKGYVLYNEKGAAALLQEEPPSPPATPDAAPAPSSPQFSIPQLAMGLDTLPSVTPAEPPTPITNSTTLTNSIGNPTPAHLAYAEHLYKRLPDELLQQVHNTEGARVLVYALLFGGNKAEREARAKILLRDESRELAKQVIAMRKQIEKLGPRVRLPLLDLSLPALKEQDTTRYQAFMLTVTKLIQADNRLSLFEYVVRTLLRKHLSKDASRNVSVKYKSFDAVLPEIGILIAGMVQSAHMTTDKSNELYTRIMRSFTAKNTEWQAPTSADQLDQALQKLARISPMFKKSLLNACADCVVADGQVKPSEVELLRAVAETLDCPMPPLVM
jgi:Zn-dependent protease with chaperone function